MRVPPWKMTRKVPSGKSYIAIEHGPVEIDEIVSFPIKNEDVPSFFVCLPEGRDRVEIDLPWVWELSFSSQVGCQLTKNDLLLGWKPNPLKNPRESQ